MNTAAGSEDQRALLDEAIVRAVSAVYAVGGDTAFVVSRLDVYRTVQEALGEKILRPDLIAEVRAVVVDMGGAEIVVGNYRLFAAMRRHDRSQKDALADSAALRKKKAPSNRVKGVNPVNGETSREWEKRLAAEGMPAELAPIKRSRRRAAGARFEQDSAQFETPALVTGGSGVHRQPRTSVSVFRGGAASAAEDALAAMDEERAILRLKAEGLSLRVIGARLRLDKMRVKRTLDRIKSRGVDVGEEG